MNDTAHTILAALKNKRQIAPITDTQKDFDLNEAYSVSDIITNTRIAGGENPVGWKIGFTNRTIWDEYGVHAPIWGPMYDSTVILLVPGDRPAEIYTEDFLQPRIEPEIVFRIAATPHSDMDDTTLLSCIEEVGHGFEIVQSVFPDWRFAASDTAAAFALHGALVCGPLTKIDHQQTHEWLEKLRSFEIDLFRDAELADHGLATNVLDGPLFALRHFAGCLEQRPMTRGIEPGDLISTGTLTRAFPVFAGETWSTQLHGIPLPGMRVRFTA